MREEWQSTRLGDVCEVLTGPFGSLLHKSDYVSNGIPLINPINIVDGSIVVGAEKTVDRKTLDRLRGYILSEGDIVVGRRGEIGRCAVVGSDQNGWLCGTGCFFIRRSAKVESRFLAELLGAPPYRQRLELAATGTTMKNLSNQALQNLTIALPPLPEQQRIVAVLDEAFAGLATATANAEKNLRNARELFESYLNSIFATTSHWSQSPIGQLATKIGSGATPTGGEKSYKKQGIPLIRSLNVHDRRFKVDDLAYLDDVQAKKLEGVTVRSGDVLLNITGASVARCCLAPEGFLPARVNQHVSIIRPIQSVILPRFLEFGLTAKVNKDRLLGVGEGAGATRQAITKAQIQEFVFSYPDVKAQRAVVDKLHGIGIETGKLEERYKAKLESLTELKQSILQKAFSGELTSPPLQAIKEAAE